MNDAAMTDGNGETTNPLAPKDATLATATANHGVAAAMAFDDDGDLDRATRGLIAQLETGRIEWEGRMVWDTATHDFCRSADHAHPEFTAHPDTVNPSLWRQGQLNAIHGLFEVVPGVWQARGYDISNITFIAGDTGWVIIDPLTTESTAAACLQLANDTLGTRPVTGVIYTHSHVDHFGGVRGVVTQEAVDAGEVPIIAPEGFMHEVVGENVIAGPAMARRAMYMFGPLLPRHERAHVDSGLGKVTPLGPNGVIAPTVDIATTGEELTVDGVRIVFQYTPDSEAPAEMNFFFPDLKLLCMAENCSHNMHNILTPRGALVRDSLRWSKYINEAIELFAADTDVVFASHHWPRFGAADGRRFLEQQRDLYRWLHDQTMRLANQGMTPKEISDALSLPDQFATESHAREYYGTVSHNTKAIYQRYLGWWDANPANLHPHTPENAGAKYVDFMGGADAVLAKARESFADGDYRWVAEVVNHLVFADPTNVDARHLQADALEQLGYQSESGPWRNFYLTGAQELRHGSPGSIPMRRRAMADALSVEQIVDILGVRIDADAISGLDVTIDLTVDGEAHVLGVSNLCLHHIAGRHGSNSPVAVTVGRVDLSAWTNEGWSAVEAQVASGAAQVSGDGDILRRVLDAVEIPDIGFAIIEP